MTDRTLLQQVRDALVLSSSDASRNNPHQQHVDAAIVAIDDRLAQPDAEPVPEPYLCIAPACGDDCSGCNKAISPQTMREYAIAHAAALAAPQPEPTEFLMDGARFKLNFNKAGNCTTFQNLAHDLQGRWVALVAAENDRHLLAVPPAAPATAVPLTPQPVAWMREGWGSDCGPYTELYLDEEMTWRDFNGWTPLYEFTPAQLATLEQAAPVVPADQWKAAIDDELVCCHIGTADSFPDARSALKALIEWHVSVALDPAVSSDAQALIDKGKSAAPVVSGHWNPVGTPLEYLTRCADGTTFRNTVLMPAHAVEWSAAPVVPLTDEIRSIIAGYRSSTYGWFDNEPCGEMRADAAHAKECIRRIEAAIERAHGITSQGGGNG